jgi:hypothetical protein
MKKLLYSLASAGMVAAAAFAATGAFFSDEEKSVGNTFIAGSLDLKVDSECHYYHYVGGNLGPNQDGYIDVGCPKEVDDDHNPDTPAAIVGTWEESDLGLHKYFWFDDLKPGDRGEDTISLHVYDNDAWGRLVINNLKDEDVTCTEPESESTDPECNQSGVPGDGELQESLLFWVWLDQGQTPGFQGESDPGEGDNIRQLRLEPLLISEGTIDDPDETWNLWEGLAPYRQSLDCSATDPDGDGQTGTAGQTETYQSCQGLARDGRLVGSTTYYFGLAWSLPNQVGNEAQTDMFAGDMTFEIIQHRNNPTPWAP